MTAKEAFGRLLFNGNSQESRIDDIKLVNQALEELEAIKSADGGEAMEAVKDIEKSIKKHIPQNYLSAQFEIIKNFILKSQAQERELAELKEKVVKYVNLSKYAVSGDLEDNEFLEFWELGENLCKGSDE